MAVKKPRAKDEPNPEPNPEPTPKADLKELAAAEARRDREAAVAYLVLEATGRPHHYLRLVCSEVGRGCYRVNMVVRVPTPASEFLEETRILHSWRVWSNGYQITRADGDVPLARLPWEDPRR